MINRELLQKLKERRCSTDELAVIAAYFDADDLDEIEKLLDQDLEAADRVTDDEMLRMVSEAQVMVWQDLGAIASGKWKQKAEPEKKFYVNRWFIAAASMITMLVALGAAWILMRDKKNSETLASRSRGEWIRASNHTTNDLPVKLPDGTAVMLAEGSILYYPEGFKGGMRNVRLRGEAFFDVKKDSLHPFTIYTDMVKIRVLGTSFSVRERKTESFTEVGVKSGKVRVESNSSGKQLLLEPNQRAVANVKDGSLTKTLVAKPEILTPVAKIQRMAFGDAPVSSVFEQLSLAYRVDIVYDKAVLGDCPVTAVLNDQPLFTKLQMICLSIGASYHLEETQIVIRGDGCGK
ncbi:FecR family protein [Dyadobacter sp. CY312]|uniref:FecR family protein n=1 Tax=Dyadobacter sp. CY312 TaxID=2907303 RepID=UPI001F45274C|nr:FecR family protein [Dyadobacter sp. CY312]MCE7044410.1 FecR family protein [Dyadobacter sp. CY312]